MRLVVIGVLVFASVSCGSGSRREPAQVPAAAKRGPSLVDPLALLPADSDIVITIDVAALRKSALFAKYRGMVREFVLPGFVECAYDPLDDIETVVAGIPMGAELGVFVVRGLDRDKTLQCLRTSKVETKTDVVFDGDIVELRNESGNTNLLTFVDARNAVMQGSKGPTRATLEKALQIGAPLREDAAFVAAEQRLKRGAGIAMVTRPGSRAFSDMMTQKLGAAASGLIAGVYFTDVVTAHVVVEVGDAATAESIVEHVKPQMAAMRQFVDRYDVRADGRRLVLDLAITEEQIRRFAELGKAMMGNGP